jgi:hypothetical protein
MSNWLFRVSKTARSADASRALRRFASPTKDIHNLNVGAIYFRGLVTFDPSIIRINWKRINQHPLVRAGNLVKLIARRSIRDVSSRKKPKPSPVGTPPRSRRQKSSRQTSGVGGESRPFKMIYSVPNMTYTSVMVGMVGFNPSRPVPGVHELGLSINQQVRTDKAHAIRRQVYRVKTRRGKIRYKTRYIGRKNIHYPIRPFMRPALHVARPQFASLWNYLNNPNMPKTPPSFPTMWSSSVGR